MEKIEYKFTVESDHPLINHIKDDLVKGAVEQASIAMEAWLGRRFPKEAYAILRKRTDAVQAGNQKAVENYENEFFCLTGLSWHDLGKEIQEMHDKLQKQIQEALDAQIREIEEEKSTPRDAGDTSSEGVSS